MTWCVTELQVDNWEVAKLARFVEEISNTHCQVEDRAPVCSFNYPLQLFVVVVYQYIQFTHATKLNCTKEYAMEKQRSNNDVGSKRCSWRSCITAGRMVVPREDTKTKTCLNSDGERLLVGKEEMDNQTITRKRINWAKPKSDKTLENALERQVRWEVYWPSGYHKKMHTTHLLKKSMGT